MTVKKIAVVIFFMLIKVSFSQYLPKDRAKLNYNQIMFEVAYKDGAKSYTFVIDKLNPDNSITNVIKQTEKFPIAFVKNLSFGATYKWRVDYILTNGTILNSEERTFSIEASNLNDPKTFTKKQHYNNKKKILDGIIWCDQYHYAVDRNGDMVWFLNPSIDKDFGEKRQIRDFKQYNDGSITFISESDAYHVDKDLSILWKAPNDGKVSGGKTEGYHHEIQLLKSGNYLVLSTEQIVFQDDDEKDTLNFGKAEFSNLIEYNKNGDVVWSWKLSENFPYEYLINSKIETKSNVISPHANGFFIDEMNDVIYVSFRDISRIIKIDKKTKKIISSWGTKLQDADNVIETDLFHAQHNVQILADGNMIIFNNNDLKNGKISSVDILNHQSPNSIRLIKTYSINCDSINDGKALKMGGVKILPNSNLLINEGTLNRVIELTANKEPVWDFQMIKKDSTGKIDKEYAIYRTNFSSSLYPYYFKIFLDSKNKLHIINKGDNADGYNITLFTKDGTANYSFKCKKLASNKEVIYNLSKYALPDYIISVSSIQSGILRKLNNKR